MQAEGQKLITTFAQQTGMTPEQLQAYMAKEYPSMTGLLQNMPQMQKDFGDFMTMMSANTEVFSRVPAGLAHYKPLVDTMKTNVDNYDSVSSLPNFNLFTVFFIVPGALLAILAGTGLFAGRERTAPEVRPTPTPTH